MNLAGNQFSWGPAQPHCPEVILGLEQDLFSQNILNSLCKCLQSRVGWDYEHKLYIKDEHRVIVRLWGQWSLQAC